MRRNIVVILTRYQLDVFLQARKGLRLGTTFLIMPEHVYSLLHAEVCGEVVYTYKNNPEYLSFKKSRRLIADVKDIVKKLKISDSDALWIANDSDVFTQVLYNLVGFKEVNLLEDGLGSYVNHSFLSFDRGLIFGLRRVKLITYLAPYYRALYSCSKSIQARVGFGYCQGVFPLQKNIDIRLVAKPDFQEQLKHPAPKGAVVFIGQPLVALRMLSKDKYTDLILKAKKNFAVSGKDFIYKPHPAEGDLCYLINSGVEVNVDDAVSAERYVFSSATDMIVVGFVSTALMHISGMCNVNDVYALKLKNERRFKGYYRVLSNHGVKVLDW